jgi:hypothetical protein
MNYKKDFIPNFKKDGTPKNGYSDWGERLCNIKMRKDNSESELSHKKTFFNGEYDVLECIHCGGETVRKIYMNNAVHYAKYECIKCYRNLQWISKPNRV